MAPYEILGELVLGFLLGTFVLWLASMATPSQNATLKTSVLCNLIFTVLNAIIIGIAMVALATNSDVMSLVLVISVVLAIIVSFMVLMAMYEISFLATIWLLVAMLGVGALVNAITGAA